MRMMFNPKWCFFKVYDGDTLIKIVNNVCDFDDALKKAQEIYDSYKSDQI